MEQQVLMEDDNLSQPFYEFVANRRFQPGGNPMGAQEATRLILNHDSRLAMLKQEFDSQQMEALRQGFEQQISPKNTGFVNIAN